ncbi:MAG: hypothetical protein KHX42_08505 [Prevotella sp.]|nr:hypothetical protein [Prevotella sp.]
MIKILGYDFEDNPVEGFFCDFRKRRIKLFFDDVYDICLNKYINKKSILTIKDWEAARSRYNNGIIPVSEYENFYSNIGIINLLTSYEKKEKICTIYAETIDNRYIEIQFDNAVVEIKSENYEEKANDIILTHNLSFDNIKINSFFYADDNKRLELSFDKFIVKNEKNNNCKNILVIKSWEEARSRIHKEGNEPIRYTCYWQENMGIISDILKYRQVNGIITVTVKTTDKRIVDLSFKNADVFIRTV